MIRQIFLWEIECTPCMGGDITSMTIRVVAENKEQAKSILTEQVDKFFYQDMIYRWSEPLIQGYQKID